MGSDFFKRAFSIKEFKRAFSKEGLKQTRQDFKKFGQDVKKANQEFKEIGQGIKEAGQEFKEGFKEANQELKEAWQKAELVKDVILDYLGGHPEFPKRSRLATFSKTDEGASLKMHKKTILIDHQDVVAINIGGAPTKFKSELEPIGHVAIVLTIKYGQENIDLVFGTKDTLALAEYDRLNRFLN